MEKELTVKAEAGTIGKRLMILVKDDGGCGHREKQIPDMFKKQNLQNL